MSFSKVKRKQIFKQIIMIFVYLFVGFVISQILSYMAEKNNNYLLSMVVLRMDIIFIIYTIVGIVAICFAGEHRIWRYFLILVDSIESLGENDDLIQMPVELIQIESIINSYKIEGTANVNKIRNSSLQQQKMMMYLAHDIRTPLTSILGYLNILSEEKELPERQRNKYIGVALRNAEVLENLIDELFEMSKYKSDDMQIEKQKINLKTLIEQLADEFYPNLIAKEMKIDNTVNNIIIDAAPDLFGRAVSNLIKNAIIYGVPQSSICISAFQNDMNTELIIKNKGKGIPSEYINSIFEEFDRGAERTISGTGLGLPIAQNIIKLHGGAIVVKSLEDETTFVITIPN